MRRALHETESLLRIFQRETLVDDGVNVVLLNGARHVLEMRAAADRDAADLQVLRKDRSHIHVFRETGKNTDHGNMPAHTRCHDGKRESIRTADLDQDRKST